MLDDARPQPGHGGIVSFITTSPYLASPAFQGMRRYIRDTADIARSSTARRRATNPTYPPASSPPCSSHSRS